MLILAFDTSTEACSVALLKDSHCDYRFEIAPQQHTRLILSMVDALLQSHQLTIADLDAIAFGQGPGSFTGLRIAAAVAQGLAFAHSIPLIPVSSLAALALAAHEQLPSVEYVIPLIDARMNEVYFSLFRFVENEMVEIIPDSLNNAQAACELIQSSVAHEKCVVVGKAWETYKAAFNGWQPAEALVEFFPSAEYIAKLAVKKYNEKNFANAFDALPK